MAVVLEVRCSAHILTTKGVTIGTAGRVCGRCALGFLATSSPGETGVEGAACVARDACRRLYVRWGVES